MNRGLNLPQIQRIMNEFERESATMDMKEEMMSDAVDDVMDDDLEDEEEESDKILKQVLDEIGVGLSQQVRVSLCLAPQHLVYHSPPSPLTDFCCWTAGRCANKLGYYLDGHRAPTRCCCRWPCSAIWEHQLWRCWRRRKSDGRRCLTGSIGCPPSGIAITFLLISEGVSPHCCIII